MADIENYEDNEIRIGRYIDNRMDADEEEAFMDELGRNAGLRRQYEDELVMRALLRRDEEGEVEMEEEMVEAVEVVPHKVVRFPYRWLAAACAAVLVGVGVFLIVQQRRETPMQELAHGTRSRAAEGQPGGDVYQQFYTLYTKTTEDPAQVEKYYTAYEQGHYQDVTAATDADIRAMGLGDQEQTAEEYLHLYKGLSYLAQNQQLDAITEFAGVMHLAPATDRVYYIAEWYSALAWLKGNNRDKASGIAAHIAQSSSPYKDKAAELSQAIK